MVRFVRLVWSQIIGKAEVTDNGQNFYGTDGSHIYSVDSLIGNGQDFFGDKQGFSVDSITGMGSDVFFDNE